MRDSQRENSALLIRPMRPSHKRSKPKGQLTRRRLEQLLASSALVKDEDCQVFKPLEFVPIIAAEMYLIPAMQKVKTILMVMWMLIVLLLTGIKTTLAVTLKASLVVIWMVSLLLLQHFKRPLAVPSLSVTLKPKVIMHMEHVTALTWFSVMEIQITAALTSHCWRLNEC